ncbi:MAG: hypothetical protein WBI61_07750, partial [Bacillota bacterium]
TALSTIRETVATALPTSCGNVATVPPERCYSGAIVPLQYCHSAVVAKALRSARSFRDEGVLRYVLYLRLLVFRL